MTMMTLSGLWNKTQLPAYIIHVQAEGEYLFPTRRTIIRDMWWTDIVRLQRHQKRIGKRRGEDKMAAYYDPIAFRPIDSFPAELKSRGFERLADAMSECPIKFIDGKDQDAIVFFGAGA